MTTNKENKTQVTYNKVIRILAAGLVFCVAVIAILASTVINLGTKNAQLMAQISAAEEENRPKPGSVRREIEFSLMEKSSDKPIVNIQPNADGVYELGMDNVYVINWDAGSLWNNEEGKVSAEIDVETDFLTTEGDRNNVINIAIRDDSHAIEYVGEINFVSVSGNLGIEFGADECRRLGMYYADHPSLDNTMFEAVFYTSGCYVGSSYGGTSGYNGSYNYTVEINGDKTKEKYVTKPEILPTSESFKTPERP